MNELLPALPLALEATAGTEKAGADHPCPENPLWLTWEELAGFHISNEP